jgi:putative ABC transport system permease protein
VELDGRVGRVSGLRGSRLGFVRRVLVFRRYPAVGMAVFACAAVLGVSAAAAPLFESSVATNVVELGMRDAGGVLASMQTRVPLAGDVVAYQERMLAAPVRQVPNADGVRTTLSASGLRVRSAGSMRAKAAQLVARDGFLAHVHVLSGATGPSDGVWIAESVASAIDAGPGDGLLLRAGDRTTTTTVAGVYRDLFVGVPDAFWAPLAAQIYPTSADEPPPPPPVLAGRTTMLALSTRLELFGTARWDVGIASGGTALAYDDASLAAAAVRRLVAAVASPATPVGSALQAPGTAAPIVDVVRDARATHESIAGPVRTFSVAGIVAALVGLLASSVYGVRRRRTEVRMLDALGLSPAALGVRAIVESALPVAAGCAAGWAIARVGVAAGGPTALLDRSAILGSARQAALGGVAGIAVLAAGTAAAVRTEIQPAGTSVRAVVRAPWETVALALAAAALYEILSRGTGPAVSPNGEVHIDAFLLLFPVLFIAGCAGLAVRSLVGGLRRASGPAVGWPVPAYLAARRLASSPRIAVLLTTAAALSVGILGYAGTIGRSLDIATNDKARLGIGSDLSVPAPEPLRLSPSAGLHATNVVRVTASSASRPGEITLLGVDPATFAAAAFWDPGFADRSLPALLRELGRGGASLPALVVGSSPDPRAIDLGGFDIAVRSVERVRAFSGQGPGSTLVVATPVLERILASHGISFGSLGATDLVWVRGPVAHATAYVEGLGLSPGAIRTAAAFVGAPKFQAISSTFAFMELLGVLAAVVALLGVVLYLQARHHARLVSYAISSRMGLTRRSHRLAVFLEIGSVLLAAVLVGSVLALVAGAVLSPWVDPMPALPPSPAFSPPVPLFAAIAIAVPVTGAIAALVVQWRTDRANVAEELRYAG